MTLPTASNSMIGGAAGLPSTGRTTSRGRVMTHTWSFESTVRPLTGPSDHLLGIVGQDGSTWKVGISRPGTACSARVALISSAAKPSRATLAARRARVVFTGRMAGCLLVLDLFSLAVWKREK